MAYVRDALRALTRLDDRVLGRWLDRRPPLRLAITLTVLAVITAILLTILIGSATPLKVALFGLVIGWIGRIFGTRPRDDLKRLRRGHSGSGMTPACGAGRSVVEAEAGSRDLLWARTV